MRDLNARREHDAGDDHGDEEQEPVHHTRGRGVLQHHTPSSHTSLADSGSGIRFLFDPPGSGMGKKSGSGMKNPDHICDS
jgi:hypothetical protein